MMWWVAAAFVAGVIVGAVAVNLMIIQAFKSVWR